MVKFKNKAIEDIIKVSRVVNILAVENKRLRKENAKLKSLLGEGLRLIDRLEKQLKYNNQDL